MWREPLVTGRQSLIGSGELCEPEIGIQAGSELEIKPEARAAGLIHGVRRPEHLDAVDIRSDDVPRDGCLYYVPVSNAEPGASGCAEFGEIPQASVPPDNLGV